MHSVIILGARMDSVLKILMRMVGFSFKHSPEQCKVQFKTFSGARFDNRFSLKNSPEQGWIHLEAFFERKFD